ncbi:hypothetical protein PSEWESI4_01151 [Pseudomonas carbonaria]|uniref:Uncharacterized protein n=1 Tax=Zestomonas carbonaria TaxID=2762745 RepID=A0A7U7I834_9GAMM|nr:hypothetical protein PSEWESI4_01151 [Pseudomonas carbonaria]
MYAYRTYHAYARYDWRFSSRAAVHTPSTRTHR